MTLKAYVFLLGFTLALAEVSPGQDCVILKRMGPADQITSHMYSFGIRGKQFQYVEGPLPKGVKFHGRLTDNDVRKIQDAGARFVVLEPKFTGADLAEARKGCIANAYASPASESSATVASAPQPQAITPKTAEVVAAPAAETIRTNPVPAQAQPVRQVQVQPAVMTTVEPSVPVQNSAQPTINQGSILEGTASITSDPEGADIFVDSVGHGHTPMILKLPAGKHSIQLVLTAHKDWTQDVDLKAGSVVNVTANFGN